MSNQKASTELASNSELLATLQADGWDIDYIHNTNDTCEACVLHKQASNPLLNKQKKDDDEFDVTSLPSIKALRSNKDSFLIALDTEFYYPAGSSSKDRSILSWQFSFASPSDPSIIENVIVCSATGNRIDLENILVYILERFNIVDELNKLNVTKCKPQGYSAKDVVVWRVPMYDTQGRLWNDYPGFKKVWKDCASIEEALTVCKDPQFLEAYNTLISSHERPSNVKLKEGQLAGYTRNFDPFHKERKFIPIAILCHFANADITTFANLKDKVDFVKLTNQIQGGLVILKSFSTNPRRLNNVKRFYPLEINLRDTMAHAPEGYKRLECLGESIGVSKLEVPDGYTKDDMLTLLKGDPVSFVNYAAQDAVVTLCYISTIYGWNKDIPVTASAAGASIVKSNICKYFGIKSRWFDSYYRGMEKFYEGAEYNEKSDKFEPKITMTQKYYAEWLTNMSKHAYYGGANGCSAIGIFDENVTHDLDLCSAYPTMMALVMDVDWLSPDCCIEKFWYEQDADLSMLKTPFDPAFFVIDRYEFPKDVNYPCIPFRQKGRIIFTRTLGEGDETYCTSTELYLALKLGAKVHIRAGVRGAVRRTSNSEVSKCLAFAVKQLVSDRMSLKQEIKTGRTELIVFEKLLKMIVCSVYGKTAQNIIEKTSFDAFYQEMKDIGISKITSATHAAMTTGGVRAILMAAMNELEGMGYKSYSYTTDGFITDAKEDVANSLTLYGIAPYLKDAREYLASEGSKIWEQKHEQKVLINLGTRSNIAFDQDGVFAHNGFTSPHAKTDRVKDRNYCLKAVMKREGKLDCINNIFTSYRKLTDPSDRQDFGMTKRQKSISMDYDMKRKPVLSTLRDKHIVYDGEVFCMGTIDTEPYENPAEENKYHERLKRRQDRGKALRTVDDFLEFFINATQSTNTKSQRLTDGGINKKVIFAAAAGHRAGKWTIPDIERFEGEKKHVAKVCEYLNKHNESDKLFTANDWKNANKKERQKAVLENSIIQDKLETKLKEMNAIIH